MDYLIDLANKPYFEWTLRDSLFLVGLVFSALFLVSFIDAVASIIRGGR